MEINPRVVFERMFGGDGTTPERAARGSSRARAFSTPSLERRAASAADRRPRPQRLDDYLANVREIERRIVQAEDQRSSAGIEAPPDAQSASPERSRST